MNPKGTISGKKVLVVGELLVDIISDQNIESLAFAAQFSTNQGGSSANLCANLKWLGVDAELVASVGNDNLGTFLINELQTVGIANTYINLSTDRQTSIVLVAKNEHTPDFIPYRSADLDIKQVDDQAIEGATIIHSTAFALSKEPARGSILTAFQKARDMGKFISIDWNFAPSIWHTDDGKVIFNEVMALAPLLKISVDDLQRFVGAPLSIEQSIEWLNSLQAEVICLTCGKDGVWYKTKSEAWKHEQALAVEKAVGVTGAGDAFWSGFLSAFIQEKSIDKCVVRALEVAKMKIEKPNPLYKIKLLTNY
ncbi:carbohydrate kinase family protein [Pedobacter yonginense]|nr:PfkB family carbohydrate kinase [Pedobacter yonginense]